MLTFTAQGRIEVYLNGVLISRHVQEREAIESISRHGGIGTYEVVYPKVLVRKVEKVSREAFVETGYGYGSGMAVEVVRRIVDVTAPTVGAMTASGMTTTQVTLAWPSVSDVDFSYFELQKSTDGINFGFLTTKITTSHIDTGLTAGSAYSYRYRVVDQSGNRSSFSSVISPIFPVVPTGLTVTSVSATTIDLDWSDNAHAVTTYGVYRSTDGSNFTLVGSPAVSSFQDTNLTAGQTYYYRVTASTAFGTSAQTSSVTQQTTAAGPDWIQNLPSISFNRGVSGQTFNFYPTYLSTNNNVQITVESGTLPAEIRIVSSPTPQLAYDGTGTGSVTAQISFRASPGISNITNLMLTSTATGTYPWTFGHAFKQGDAPSYIASSNTTNFQAQIRNRWPDGSVKYAVLSGVSNLTANVQGIVNVGATSSAPTGTNIQEKTPSYLGSNISVTLTGAGAGTYTPSTAASNGITAWDRTTARKVREFLGPVMSEFHYYSPTSDSHITIWWYVRVYSDRTEVETVIENGWLKLASPATKTYGVTVAISGSTVYSGSLTHTHHSRWSRVDWIGGDPAITPQHNVSYLRSTKLVPNYGWTSPTASAYTGLYTTTNPVPYTDWGSYQADITGTGSAPQIGLLPTWEALYCTAGHATAYASTVAHARILGRYGHHFRDETTGRPADWRSYQTGQPTYGFLVMNVNGFPLTATGTDSPHWELAHHGSTAYLPYILTGRWSFLEECQFGGAWALCREGGRPGAGIIEPGYGAATIRGGAWAWRSMAQAAAISPTQIAGDTDLQASFAACIDATTTHINSTYINAAGSRYNTIGYMMPISHPMVDGQINADGYGWQRNWMHSFQVNVWGHIAEIAPENASQSAILTVATHAMQGVLRMIVPGTNSQWNWRRLAQYDAPYTSASNVLLTTAQAYAAMVAVYGALADAAPAQAYYDGSLITESTTLDTGQGYAMYKISALSFGINLGIADCQAAYNTLATATNLGDQFLPTAADDGWHNDPRWGIVPR